MFKFICSINHPSLHEPTLSASFLRTLLHWCRNPGRKPDRRCHHVLTDEIAICGCHPVARGTPPGTPSSAAGHEGGPGKTFLCPRPEPAGGPRAPAHPHAGTEDGAAGRPGGVPRLVREDRRGMWVAPDGLASAPHPPANRGVGGTAAASPEPPGL